MYYIKVLSAPPQLALVRCWVDNVITWWMPRIPGLHACFLFKPKVSGARAHEYNNYGKPIKLRMCSGFISESKHFATQLHIIFKCVMQNSLKAGDGFDSASWVRKIQQIIQNVNDKWVDESPDFRQCEADRQAWSRYCKSWPGKFVGLTN